jgi:hypothetical protein
MPPILVIEYWVDGDLLYTQPVDDPTFFTIPSMVCIFGEIFEFPHITFDERQLRGHLRVDLTRNHFSRERFS